MIRRRRSLTFTVGILASFAALPNVMGYPGDVFQNASPAATPSDTPSAASDGDDAHAVSDDGTFTYVIPIPTAPNRQGAVPEHALRYSSRHPLRGGVAAGWLLDIPRIELDTSVGRLGALTFKSSLSGTRLVPVTEPGVPGQTYRARFDPTYTRYERTTDAAGTVLWVARTGDGRVLYFGETPESRDVPHAASAQGGNEGRFLLTRIVDRFGNQIRYVYEKTTGTLWNGAAVGAPVDITIKSIEYGANANAGLSDHARIVFEYANAFDLCPNSNVPIGARFDYRTGFPTYEGARRLTAVRLDVKQTTTWESRKRLLLAYDTTELSCASGKVHAPLRILTAMQEWARSPENVTSVKPPVTFQYGRSERELTVPTFVGELGQGKVALSLAKAGGWPTIDMMMLDVDGDGRQDELRSLPTAHAQRCGAEWRRNRGDGSFDPPAPFGVEVNNVSALPAITWANGTRNDSTIDPDVREGCSLAAQFTRVTNVPVGDRCGFPSSYLSYRFVDLTGDGRADLVTAIDAPIGQYRPQDDLSLWPQAPSCSNDGACSTANGWGLCPIITPMPYQRAPGDDDPPQTQGCANGQCRTDVQCDPNGGPCECTDCEQWESPPFGTNFDAPIDMRDPTSPSDDTDHWLWSGPSWSPSDVGQEGRPAGTYNPACRVWPEVQCGRYVLRVHENLGNGQFGPPSVVMSPIPLETDRATSRLGAGALAASSSWHGFIDIDGDSHVDAVYMPPFFFKNDFVDTPGAFQVWRGDGHGGFLEPAIKWKAPRLLDSAGEATVRARVSLSQGAAILEGGAVGPWHRKTTGKVTLQDINGDGLPDYVDTRWYQLQAPVIRVFFNNGAGFENTQALQLAFPTYAGTVLHKTLPSYEETQQLAIAREVNSQLQVGFSRANLRQVDLDADGLTDLVDLPDITVTETNPFINGTAARPALFVNTGDRLVPMGTPAKMANWWRGLSRITLTDIVTGRWRVLTDFVDVDGDGLAELVNRDVGAAYCNPTEDQTYDFSCLEISGNTNALRDPEDGQGMRMLRQVNNGRGGRLDISYAPIRSQAGRVPHPLWTVTKLVETPGPAADGAPAPKLETTFSYDTPIYNADELGRFGFRGFARVVRVEPTGARRTRRFAYDQHFAGLPAERRVHDATGRIHEIVTTTHTIDALFAGTIEVPHPHTETVRTCRNDQDDATCAAAGVLLHRIESWVPFSPIGGPPIMHVPKSLEVAPALASGPGTKGIGYDFAGVSTPSSYRVVQTEERRYAYEPGYTLLGRTATVFDGSYRFALERHENVDPSRISKMSKTYDPLTGNVRRVTRPKHFGTTVATTYDYDASQVFVTLETNELGHAVMRSFDLATGALRSARGPNKKSCGTNCVIHDGYAATIDGFGRPLDETVYVDDPVLGYRPELVARNRYFDVPSPFVSATRERRIDFGGDRWTREETLVDGFGRKVIGRLYDGTVVRGETRFFHDAAGQVVRVEAPRADATDGSRVTWKTTYDSLGRVLMSQPPGGAPGRAWSYDALVTETRELPAGPDVQVTRTELDAMGRRIKTSELTDDGSWADTRYEYDGNDRMRRVISADGTVTEIEFDWVGNRTGVKRGDRKWSFAYSDARELIAIRSPLPPGASLGDYTTTLVYDAVGRPTERIAGRRAATDEQVAMYGEEVVRWMYDDGPNGIGRQTSASTTYGETGWTFDALGHVIEERRKISILGGAVSDVRTSRASYNALGLAVSRSYGDGTTAASSTTVMFKYDGRGMLATAKAVGVGPLASLVRSDAGIALRRTVGAQIRATRSFDEAGRFLSMQVDSLQPGDAAMSRRGRVDVHYAPAGEIDSASTWLALGPAVIDHAWSFGYDRRGQLVSARGPLDYKASFDYSPGGRIEVADIAAAPEATGVHPRSVVYQYADASGIADPDAPIALEGQVGGMSLDYDVSGNATTRRIGTETWHHTYDNLDRQREVIGPDGRREVFWYDDAGQRTLVSTFTPAGALEAVRWTFAGTEIRYGGTGAQTLTVANVDGDGPIARIRNRNELELVFHDPRANPLLVLAADGTVVAGFSFGPYGERMAEIGPRAGELTERFNGKDLDEVSGLGYYGARYYDVRSLTWTQSDPLYRWAPDAAVGQPRRATPYTFSLNNPISYVDPNGLTPTGEGGESGASETPSADEDPVEGYASCADDASVYCSMDLSDFDTVGWGGELIYVEAEADESAEHRGIQIARFGDHRMMRMPGTGWFDIDSWTYINRQHWMQLVGKGDRATEDRVTKVFDSMHTIEWGSFAAFYAMQVFLPVGNYTPLEAFVPARTNTFGGGVIVATSDPVLATIGKELPWIAGEWRVVMHGNATAAEVSASEVASMLRAQGFQSGQVVRHGACFAGESAAGPAAQLANELGQGVFGSTAPVSYAAGATEGAASTTATFGSWILR